MLDEKQKDHLQELFAEAVELAHEEQALFLQRLRADEPELHAELAELLGVVGSRLTGFMEQPLLTVPASRATSRVDPHEASDFDVTPPTIGGYEDLEPIAVGGMGTVYRAHQVRPVRRTVAIKVIRPGMDSRSVLSRFEVERQALARMAHPYIAAVHDAGVDSGGRPYIAMEFVEGRPITQTCLEEGLGLDQRLALFVKVCDAVDHAHRRGVLHRDIKPSNILVMRSGAEWIPKVIDFGIAKAMEDPLGDSTLLTQHGTFLGTPDYMSPEQFDGPGVDVDTRADVYSLGVLLYELISGQLPFDPARLRSRGMLQMGTVLRDEVPPKPSTRAREHARAGAGGEPAAAERVAWWGRLPGDLDWIAMKALEKDPARRYGSPHELAADITSYLQHRPVAAGPPSGFYRMRKFTRRYRVQVTAAALVLVSLVLGLAGTIHYLLQARVSAEAAEQRAREAVAAKRQAEGIRIATDAAMLADESPNLALLLAIEASRLTDDDAVNRTIHRVLPKHRLTASLEANDHDVRQLHFLDDGRLIARPYDSVVLMFDPDTGAVLRRFTGHTDVIEQFDVHPTREVLLTASRDDTAKLWDMNSGACLATVAGAGAGLGQAVFSPDGSRFVTADLGGSVRLYGADGGGLQHVLATGGRAASTASFDPAGQLVATSTRDGPVRLFSASDGALLREIGPSQLALHAGERVEWVRVLPAGDRLLIGCFAPAASEFRMQLVDLDGARLLDGYLPAAGFLGPDRMVVGATDQWRVIDLRRGEDVERHPLEGLRGLLGVAPDGTWAIGTDAQRDLCVVDLHLPDPHATGTMRKLRGESDKRNDIAVAFHPDGERFAVAGSRVRIWAAQPEFAPVDLPGVPEELRVESLAVGAEPMVLLRRVSAERPTWELWNVRTRTRRCVVRHEAIEDLLLAPDATRMVGTSWTRVDRRPSGEPRLLVLDADGRIQEDHRLEPAREFAARPDGRGVLFFDRADPANPTAQLFDLRTGALGCSFEPPAEWWRWTGGSDYGRLMFLFGGRSRTDVLDAATGGLLASVRGPSGSGHYGGAVSADGRRLLIVLGTRVARVFDLTQRDTGGAPVPIAEYTNIVRSNNYTGDFLRGGSLAWVMCSNEVHVFETATGRPFTVLQLEDDCADVAGSPDGTELYTVSRLGRVQRWPLDPVAVALRVAVGRLTRRQLDQYEIGTPEQRSAREIEALRAVPSVRHHARLGEIALESGDLDGAIVSYLAATSMGRLAPQDRLRYLRLVELLCRRLARPDLDAAGRSADRVSALDGVREAVRCGASREELLALPGIEALTDAPEFATAVGR